MRIRDNRSMFQETIARNLPFCDEFFIITSERHNPIEQESELLARFRELSNRGRNSVFMTLDALERLAPNLRQTIRDKLKK